MKAETLRKKVAEKKARQTKYIFTRMAEIRAEVHEQETAVGFAGPSIMLDAIAELKIQGYLMALRDFGIIDRDECDGFVREIGRKEISHRMF